MSPRTKVEDDALRSLLKLMHFGEAQIAVASEENIARCPPPDSCKSNMVTKL